MEIQQAKELKAKLERDLSQLIQEYNQETQLFISSVQLEYIDLSYKFGPKQAILSVKCSLEI